MESDLSIKELDKLILGGRTQKLSPEEIGRLIRGGITSVKFFYIVEGLKRRVMNPNEYILEVIKYVTARIPNDNNMDERYDIALFGVGFRGSITKANANQYIPFKGHGIMHLLAYAIMNFGGTEKGWKQTIDNYMFMLLILMVSGADIMKPVFSNEGDPAREDENLYNITAINPPNAQQAVKKYLEDAGYRALIGRLECFKEQFESYMAGVKKKYTDLVSDEILTRLAIYLDNPALLKITKPFDAIAKFHAINIYKNSNISFVDESKILSHAISTYSTELFNLIFEKTGNISYNDFNILLLNTGEIKNRDYGVLYLALQENIKNVIKSGFPIDIYQMGIISSFSKEFESEILQILETPHWVRECSGANQRMSLELQQLAYHLNIDINDKTTKNVICSDLSQYSQMDPEKIAGSSAEKNKRKFNSKMAKSSDYVLSENPEPEYKCFNFTTYPYYEYTSLDFAAYRDNAGIIWCFTKGDFEKLIALGVNLYNNQPLPSNFISTVTEQMKLLKKLKVDLEIPVVVNDLIGDLKKGDAVLGLEEINKKINTFDHIAYINGYNKNDLMGLSNDRLSELANSLDEKINFSLLIKDHKIVTLIFTALEKFEGPQADHYIKRFFDKAKTLPKPIVNKAQMKPRGS